MNGITFIRKIDDLGRIVIPKEMRRTLRIRDGESLEIFVEDEMISLKKYSSMSDLNDIANDLVNVINQILSKEVMITDRDKVISISGNLKNKYIGKNISKFLEKKLSNREVIIEKNLIDVEFIDSQKEKCSYTLTPILMNGDVIGTVIIFSLKESITDMEVKMANLVSKFLGKHIEE